jgi:hypothetical protein
MFMGQSSDDHTVRHLFESEPSAEAWARNRVKASDGKAMCVIWEVDFNEMGES